MSILDTFYTLFKSQGADEVKKDNERVKKSNDDVNTSMQKSNAVSEELGKSFKNLGNQLVGMATAGISLAGLLGGIRSAIDYAKNINVASQALQVNVSELDAWGNAVGQWGGSIQTFESALSNLRDKLGTTGDVALKLLPQLADSFSQMNSFTAMNYGKMLGLDEATILLLQKGRREVEAIVGRQKELGVVTKEDAEAARRFNYAWQETGHSLRSVFLEVAADLLPMLTKMFNLFTDKAQYFRKHSDIIVGGLIAIGVAAAFAFGKITLITTAVTALISAFGVLYEDIKAYKEGKPSFIGKVDKKYGLSAKRNAIKSKIDAFAKKHPMFFLPFEQNVQPHLEKGKNQLLDITKSPISYQNAQNYVSNSPNKSYAISIDEIKVLTQATDSKGIAKDIGIEVNKQFQQTVANFDDGVAG